MTLSLSTSAKRARTELNRQCGLTVSADFDVDSNVIHEDGSTFFVRNAFTCVWVDPVDTKVWVFLISEHNEPMYWCAEDLTHWHWASYQRLPCPGTTRCDNCEGMGVVPNRAFLKDGPLCGCGLPSKTQSGSCGTPDCDPTCKPCKGIGWAWKSTSRP